jgi:hypothetical protein
MILPFKFIFLIFCAHTKESRKKYKPTVKAESIALETHEQPYSIVFTGYMLNKKHI